jgi:hypothetical protein
MHNVCKVGICFSNSYVVLLSSVNVLRLICGIC